MLKTTEILVALLCLSVSIAKAQSILGIDISKWQGDVNWQLVYAQGKIFAYVKATEGMTYTDPFFTKNIEEGVQAGVIMGAYHFARPDNNTAIEDATNYLNQANICIGNNFLPPVLDLENPNSTTDITTLLTSSELSNWVVLWCEKVEMETGIQPIIYTNSYIAKYLENKISQYGLWIAKPGTPPNTPPNDLGIWDDWNIKQYSWEGSVLGINGNVDLNIFNGDIEDFKDFIQSESVALKEVEAKSIIFYPNPTNGNSIYYTNTAKIEKIILLNSIGQYIRQIDQINNRIDLHGLETGIYYVKLFHNNGTISHDIIQKL